MIISEKYILFAWESNKIHGGFNDNCGLFKTPVYAMEFFKTSNHCKLMDCYQIVDIESLNIITEGKINK